MGRGRGEILEPITTLSEKVVLLLFPNVQVSTKCLPTVIVRNATSLKKTELEAANLRNDFQDVTNKLYPEVEKAFVWLSKRCEKVQMVEPVLLWSNGFTKARQKKLEKRSQITGELPYNVHE